MRARERVRYRHPAWRIHRWLKRERRDWADLLGVGTAACIEAGLRRGMRIEHLVAYGVTVRTAGRDKLVFSSEWPHDPFKCISGQCHEIVVTTRAWREARRQGL